MVEEGCRAIVAITFDSERHALLRKVPDSGHNILVFAQSQRPVVPTATLVEIEYFLAIGRGRLRGCDFGESRKLVPTGIVETAFVSVRGCAAGIDAIRFIHSVHRLDGKMQELLRVGIRRILPIVPSGGGFVLGRDRAANAIVDRHHQVRKWTGI